MLTILPSAVSSPCGAHRAGLVLDRAAAEIDHRALFEDDLAILADGRGQGDAARIGEQLIDRPLHAARIARQVGERGSHPGDAIQRSALAQIDRQFLAAQRAAALQGLVGEFIAEGLESEEIVRGRDADIEAGPTRRWWRRRPYRCAAGWTGGFRHAGGINPEIGLRGADRHAGAWRDHQRAGFHVDQLAAHLDRARHEIGERALRDGLAIFGRQNLDAAAFQTQFEPRVEVDLAVAGDAGIGADDAGAGRSRCAIGDDVAIEDHDAAFGVDQPGIGDFARGTDLPRSGTVLPPDDRRVGDLRAIVELAGDGGIDADGAEGRGHGAHVIGGKSVGIGIGDELHRLGRDHQGLAGRGADGAVIFDIGREQIDEAARIRRHRARRQAGGDAGAGGDGDVAFHHPVVLVVGEAFRRHRAAIAEDSGIEEEAIALGQGHGRGADIERRGDEGMHIDLRRRAEHHAIGI